MLILRQICYVRVLQFQKARAKVENEEIFIKEDNGNERGIRVWGWVPVAPHLRNPLSLISRSILLHP